MQQSFGWQALVFLSSFTCHKCILNCKLLEQSDIILSKHVESKNVTTIASAENFGP
jgi:hypothetical protein